MKIGVVEWGSGGGVWHDQEAFEPSQVFVRQGLQMLAAIVSDLIMAGHSVQTLRDSRFPLSDYMRPFDFAEQLGVELAFPLEMGVVQNATEFHQRLKQLSRAVDAVLVIAPETGGRLMTCSRWLASDRERCWFPTGDFLAVGCSKHATASKLCDAGVQADYFRGELISQTLGTVVSQVDLARLQHVGAPAVLKPDDGAGSEGIQVIQSWEEFAPPKSGAWRLEPWVPGVSVSLVALIHGRRFEIFEPSYQILEPGPSFHYLNSIYPVSTEHSYRAIGLGERVLDALGPTRGFVGLDLVLHETDPLLDVVVDLNPRMTASYVSLRNRVPFNLAERWVEICSSSAE